MTSTLIDHSTIALLETIARRLHRAGIMRDASEDQVFAALLLGAELGLAPGASARAISYISGRPVIASDAMVGLVLRRRDVCQHFRCVSTSAEAAEYETLRVGATEPVRHRITIAEARAAGLVRGATWSNHPAAMLRARCAATLARLVYPDLLAGAYVADEGEEIARNDGADDESDTSALGAVRRGLERIRLPHIGEVVDLYQRHSQALHADDSAQAAVEAICDWEGDRGYALTASETQRILARAWSEDALAILDELALLVTAPAPAVVRWYESVRTRVEALPTKGDVQLVIARRWALLAGVDATRPRATFAAALAAAKTAAPESPADAAPPAQEPPADAPAPEAEPAPAQEPAAPAPIVTSKGTPIVTSKGTTIASEEDGDRYAAAVTAVKHLQSAARKYGTHPFLRAPLARRLAELAGIPADNAQTEVDRLALESARPAGDQ